MKCLLCVTWQVDKQLRGMHLLHTGNNNHLNLQKALTLHVLAAEPNEQQCLRFNAPPFVFYGEVLIDLMF